MLREPYHTLAEVVHKFESTFNGKKMYYSCQQRDNHGALIDNDMKFRGVIIDDQQVIIGTRKTKLRPDIKTGYLFARIAPWQEWINTPAFRAKDTRDENGVFPTLDGLKLHEDDDRSTFGLYYATTVVNRSGKIAAMHASAYGINDIQTRKFAQNILRGYNSADYSITPDGKKLRGLPAYEEKTLDDVFEYTLALIRESAKQVN